jgi:hypothetical protein
MESRLIELERTADLPEITKAFDVPATEMRTT